MTFEEWLSKWLAEKLQKDIKTVITPEAVSVELRDVSDTGNKWMRDAVFGIYCKYKSKEAAAYMSRDIQNTLSDLRNENYVNAVYLDTEQAERVGAPFTWTYTIGVRIVHRRRTEW